MPTNVIQLFEREQYSGSYEFTITHEPDEDFRKYLARKLADVLPATTPRHSADAAPLDISLDDIEGDVVAGLSAVTVRNGLHIDMLWVDEPLRHNGIGHRLMQMAEEIAIRRGCTRASITVTGGVEFYVGQGYMLTGTVQPLPALVGDGKVIAFAPRQAVYTLMKDLT